MKTNLKIMLTVGILACFGMMMNVPASHAAKMQSTPKTATAVHKSISKKKHISKVAVNAEIKNIQEALIKNGAKIKADGIMGKHTRAAIRSFQKKHGLKVTGKLDKMTLAKLK